jgi:prepilin-type N-terminal cleavage/methylation domain-containing protein
MPRPAHHRGLTFIEVVVAVALLGVVAGAMFGATSFATGMQLREQRRLACAEVANRLMLQYLDEPSKMSELPKTTAYGPDENPSQFRWEYREEPIQLIKANADAWDQTRESTLPPDRFRQVTIRVWLSEASGGSRFPDDSTATFTLSRMLDPIYPRNPDSFMNMLNDPVAFRDFMGNMMTNNQGNTFRGNGSGNQGRNQNGQGRQPGRGQFGPGGVGPGQAFGRSGQNRQGRAGGFPNFNTGPRSGVRPGGFTQGGGPGRN